MGKKPLKKGRKPKSLRVIAIYTEKDGIYGW